MDALLVMIGNWKTTLIGLAAAGAIYVSQVGGKMPATKQEWWAFGWGVLALALGVAVKDATTGSRPAIALLTAGLLLGGCSTLPVLPGLAKPAADLSKFTMADVDQAIAMASAAKDAGAPYRLRCYTTLKKYVGPPSAPAPSLPRGVVSAYELAAELDASARSGASLIPPDIHADCAVIGINAAEFATRVGAKFAPAPGAAAVGLIK